MEDIPSRNLFTGKERDDETGWDYFGTRYYSPAIGRWWSVDPMAHKRPGLTPYNYVRNNPLVYIDPTGLVDIYLWFNNSSLTTEQQKIVSNNIATSFTNAGVKDVNVKTANWFHRIIIGPGVGENIDIKFNKEGDPQGGQAGGRAEYGSGEGDVYEQALPNDDLETPIDEKATAASNVGTHEAGHSSKAKLKHSNPPDGSVMDEKIYQNDIGTKRRDFNEEHSKELQKTYNKEEDK